MNKKMLYSLTEWEWLKLKLEVSAIGSRSEVLSVVYEFRDSEIPVMFDFRKSSLPEAVDIACLIFGAHAGELTKQRASKQEQLEYYQDWISLQKMEIGKIIKKLPALGKEIDLNRHVAFLIMRRNGMGSSLVCQILGDEIVWLGELSSDK